MIDEKTVIEEAKKLFDNLKTFETYAPTVEAVIKRACKVLGVDIPESGYCNRVVVGKHSRSMLAKYILVDAKIQYSVPAGETVLVFEHEAIGSLKELPDDSTLMNICTCLALLNKLSREVWKSAHASLPYALGDEDNRHTGYLLSVFAYPDSNLRTAVKSIQNKLSHSTH